MKMQPRCLHPAGVNIRVQPLIQSAEMIELSNAVMAGRVQVKPGHLYPHQCANDPMQISNQPTR